MKVVWAFGISLLAAFYISSAMVVGWAESSEKVTEFEPVSLEDASYIDLMDEINRLMSVQPADIEDAETAKETFDRFENMVRGLVKINDLETAAKLANHARKLFPDQVRSAFLAGWVKGLEGNHKEAIDLLLEGLGEKTDILPDPDSTTQSEIKTTLAGFLIESGNAEEAVTYLKELTQDESAGALAHYLAGLAYHQTGDAYQCAKSYKQALQIDENLASPNDYLVYAWAEDKLNRPKRSDSILDKGIERFPMEPGLYFNRAANHEVMGSSREAFYDYQMEMLVGGEDSAFSEEAQKRINKILSIQAKLPSPDKDLMNVAFYIKAHEQLANIDPAQFEDEAALKKQYERMDSYLDKVLEGVREPHPFLIYLKAERLMEKESYDQAANWLEKATEDFPGQVLFEMKLAQVYAKQGKQEKSEKLIREAQLAAPDHWIVRETLGPNQTQLTEQGLGGDF